MSRAGMRDSTAVKVMVAMRSVLVGLIFLNESIALINVSEPPYMFSAVTEMRPRVEKTSAIAPKPENTSLPAASIDAIVSNLSPAHAASAAPRHISQIAPSAEPQYVHRNVLRTVTDGGK